MTKQFYFAPVGCEVYCNLHSLCMSTSAYVHCSVVEYLKTTCPNFIKLSVNVARGSCSIILWRQCDMFCTSGYVDAVIGLHIMAMAYGGGNRACAQSDSLTAARESLISTNTLYALLQSLATRGSAVKDGLRDVLFSTGNLVDWA